MLTGITSRGGGFHTFVRQLFPPAPGVRNDQSLSSGHYFSIFLLFNHVRYKFAVRPRFVVTEVLSFMSDNKSKPSSLDLIIEAMNQLAQEIGAMD